MFERGSEKALAGWATTRSGDDAPGTAVTGSWTSHSLQLSATTEMRTTFQTFEGRTPMSAFSAETDAFQFRKIAVSAGEQVSTMNPVRILISLVGHPHGVQANICLKFVSVRGKSNCNTGFFEKLRCEF